MYSASRGILYTPPPAGDDDGDENRAADEAESTREPGTVADGASPEDAEAPVAPAADD